jgi:hypothetical protein
MQRPSNANHESTTAAEARLCRTGSGKEATALCRDRMHTGHRHVQVARQGFFFTIATATYDLARLSNLLCGAAV